jgi:diguanylate cyclase (GGDEF)-like protein
MAGDAAERSLDPCCGDPAPDGSAGDGPVAPAVGRVRVFALLVACAAGLLWWAAGPHLTTQAGPIDVPWWGLLPAVVAAQGVNVHFQVRRQAHGVALCHLPVLLGLVCTDPLGFVVARTLGGSLAMAVVRRQRGLKLMLNTASYALEATVAVTLLQLLAPWPLPAAIYVAMVLADMTSFTVVSVAIMIFERRTDAAARLQTLLLLLPINLVATSFGLLAVAALWRGHGYLWLLGGVTACLLLFYRNYARLRGRHSDLGLLQGLAASLPALTAGSQELADVLERTRALLVADRASLWLPDGTVTAARHDGAPEHGGGDGSSPPAPVRVRRPLRPPAWSRLTSTVAYDDGRQQATLVVQDRLGAVRPFNEDDKHLLDAAAALIGSALDRGTQRQRMLDAARRDPLTGLWTLTEGSLRAAVEAGRTQAQGLLVLDVIGLQDVNDSLGHDAGDALLRTTAARLQDRVGAQTVTARIGGDELMALLRHDDPGPEQLARAVAGTVELAGARFELRIRAGYCAATDADSFQSLLRNAQAALSRSAAGGTRYRSWTPQLTVDPSRRLRLAVICKLHWPQATSSRSSSRCAGPPTGSWSAPRRWPVGGTRSSGPCHRTSSSPSPSRPA